MANPLAAGRRSLRLIEHLADYPYERSFSDLAKAMDLSGASLTRLLKMLMEENWIRQRQSNGHYTVGYRTLQLGDALRSFGLQSAQVLQSVQVQGTVANLAHQTGHSACIASYHGDCFVLLAKTELHNCYHFIDVFAPNTDWIQNGMGQFLLAYQPKEDVERVYRDIFGLEVPQEHLDGFEAIRKTGLLVRTEGAITRFVMGLDQQGSGIVRNVVSVAALNAHPINKTEILSKLEFAAKKASSGLAGRPFTPVEQPEI